MELARGGAGRWVVVGVLSRWLWVGIRWGKWRCVHSWNWLNGFLRLKRSRYCHFCIVYCIRHSIMNYDHHLIGGKTRIKVIFTGRGNKGGCE